MSSVAPEINAKLATTAEVSRLEKLGYGLGDAASNLYWKTFEFFLLYFYTDVFGLTAKAAGAMLLGTRIWDAINDPLIGYLADRTRTTWGRFRPYILWMSAPLTVAGVLTFYTPNLSPTSKTFYACVTYALLMMAYSAVNVPYGALMAALTPSSTQRVSISTYRFVCAAIGGMFVQYFTLRLVRFFGGVETVTISGISKQQVIDEPSGFFWTMVVYSTVALVLFLITFASTRERVSAVVSRRSTVRADLRFLLTSNRVHQFLLAAFAFLTLCLLEFSPPAMMQVGGLYILLSIACLILRRRARRTVFDSQPSSLHQDLADLLCNRPWMALFGFGLFQLAGVFIRGSGILYYFKYYVGDTTIVPAFWVCGSAAAILGMLLTKTIVARLGHRATMVIANVAVAANLTGFFFLTAEQTTAMFTLQLLGSFCGGPIPVLLWSMYADTADYSHWKNGRQATGLVFSAASFSQKLGCAIGASCAGFLLSFFDYARPIQGIEQPQSEQTLFGLCLMVSLIPAVCFLLASGFLAFYNLDRNLLQKISQSLHTNELAV